MHKRSTEQTTEKLAMFCEGQAFLLHIQLHFNVAHTFEKRKGGKYLFQIRANAVLVCPLIMERSYQNCFCLRISRTGYESVCALFLFLLHGYKHVNRRF